MTKLLICTVIGSVLTSVVLVIGYATDGWIRYEVGFREAGGAGMEATYSFGLWRAELCTLMICKTFTYSSLNKDEGYSLARDMFESVKYQAVATIGLILMIIGGMAVIGHCKRSVQSSCCGGIVAVICYTLTGGLYWYIVGKFIKLSTNLLGSFQYTSSGFGSLQLHVSVLTPYSMILLGFAAAGMFIVALLMILDLCLSQRGLRTGMRMAGNYAYNPPSVMVTTSTSTTMSKF